MPIGAVNDIQPRDPDDPPRHGEHARARHHFFRNLLAADLRQVLQELGLGEVVRVE